MKDPKYQVYCSRCDSVWEPEVRSPLWWKANQVAENGRLDAIHVSARDCGCVEKQIPCEEPYQIIGYTMDLHEYDIRCNTFVELILACRRLGRGDTFIVNGTTPKTAERLRA